MAENDGSALGVGILGTGRVSRDHGYAVASNPALKLVAAADPDADRCKQFADRQGCDAHSDHGELLSRDDVDLVLAGLPHWLHAQVTIDALNAGKHVLIEKPMAMTVDECRAMVEAAEANNVRLMVGHTQHFFPANLATKDLIDRGDIGDLVMATQAWHKPFGLAGRPPWMLDREKGGGMWLMNGAHMLDCLIWFIGSSVAAVKGCVTNRIVGQQADDAIIAFLEFTNGVCATLAHSGSKRPDPPPPEQFMTTEVVGTEGSVRVISYEGRAWVNTKGDEEEVPLDRDAEADKAVIQFLNEWSGAAPDTPLAQSAVEQTRGIADEIAAFADAIQSGTDTPVSNAHSLAVMEAVLAVEESSRSGKEVRLDWLGT